MGVADDNLGSTIAVNDAGLVLTRDDFGTWVISGSGDGSVYATEDRLVWLLPLLERSPADVLAAVPEVHATDTPFSALVRFALTAGGVYWSALALEWLESAACGCGSWAGSSRGSA